MQTLNLWSLMTLINQISIVQLFFIMMKKIIWEIEKVERYILQLLDQDISCGMSHIVRRKYEVPIKELKMPAHYYGYTNRILVQEGCPKRYDVNFFIPTYLIFKIKSIQDIDIQKLTGIISSVLIVYVLFQGLPDPLVHMLESNIELQINRSELLFLKESRQNNIAMEKTQKMLKFTINRNFSTMITSQTLWSPFEIIRLVLSVTFKSISKRYTQFQKTSCDQGKYFNENQRYTISFNCMRNNEIIPINYSLGCAYSVYDLAEKKLDAYHTNIESYSEVIRKFSERKRKQTKISQGSKKQNTKSMAEYKPKIGKDDQNNFVIGQQENNRCLEKLMYKIQQNQDNKKKIEKIEKKQQVKLKYFQYTHFIIPLYKYPGNALATIFIPIFLLSLLSLAIFFQSNHLSERIGSIATMILGYIALIPSIKEQLPPSSKITVLEIVIYVSTLCCLFSLIESFLIDDHSEYVFDWKTNYLFLVCLLIHLFVFLFIGTLMLLHIFVWEPSYNLDVVGRRMDPEKDPHEWINPYCDYELYKANSKIFANNKKHLIVKYESPLSKRENSQDKLQDQKNSQDKLEDKLQYQKNLQFLDKVIKSGVQFKFSDNQVKQQSKLSKTNSTLSVNSENSSVTKKKSRKKKR